MTPGTKPKPLEEKYRLGNPGKRPLPDRSTLVPLPAATEPPEPTRPLGQLGREMWDRIWTSGAVWLAKNIDAETVLVICELIDERQRLRVSVLKFGDWRERAALRALDHQVLNGLGVIGFNPVDRSRLGVAEVRGPSRLEQLREKKKDATTGTYVYEPVDGESPIIFDME